MYEGELRHLRIIMVWIKKKKVTQRAQRTTEISEAGKTLCVFIRPNDFLLKPFKCNVTSLSKNTKTLQTMKSSFLISVEPAKEQTALRALCAAPQARSVFSV